MKRVRAWKWILRSAIIVVFLGTLSALLGVVIIASGAHYDEERLTRPRTVAVCDVHGDTMTIGGGYAEMDDIPGDLVAAFVAVEDKRFYRHHGLDYTRMAGALWHNLTTRSLSQGASTISCQLIKNTHLSQEKTFTRKIREAKLALELEKRHSKEEILEMYLNVIYLGSGIYGVDHAAHAFFGKSPADLSTVECAAIAATTANPAHYSPRLSPDGNRTRRNMVLRLMWEQGYIDEAAFDEATHAEITLAGRGDAYEAYRTQALDEAARCTGLDAKTLAQGYTVHSYCDPALQQKANDALASCPAEADKMVAFCDSHGQVQAFSADFSLDIAAIRRQIGSTIKPFVYAAAIERRMLLPDTMLEDEPTNFGEYTPHNYHDVYLGQLSARDALARSSNVAAVKVLSYVGVDVAMDAIEAVGLPLHPADRHLALALGGTTYGHTFDELLTAYATLSAMGVRHRVGFVRAVVDPDGRTIYQRDEDGARVMREDTAYLVNAMLSETTRTGTAKRLGTLGLPISAKTGTVMCGDGNSDIWCVAYDADGVALAWAGNLGMRADKMLSSTGGGDTCRAVYDLLSSRSAHPFPRPDTIVERTIDDYAATHRGTLLLASPNTPARYLRTILCPEDTVLATSAVFERAPAPVCRLARDNNTLRLYITPQAMCSYLVEYDNGFLSRRVREITAADLTDGQPIECDYAMGWWTITPILHGKHPIVGEAYRVLVP